MKKNKLFSTLHYFIYFLFMAIFTSAMSAPLTTFSPITPTTISLSNSQTAIVQYIVTNASSKTHTLMLVPKTGITQITSTGNCPNPFVLGYKQTCMLTLKIYGNQIPAHLFGGPVVCQQGPDGGPSPNQCYQPSAGNVLNITMIGSQPAALYAGTQNGNVYYSLTEGVTWTQTTPPAGGNPINSIIATSSLLYAGAANGSVYSSFNNGITWSAIATPAPGFAINGLYVSASNKLYIASANGRIFICGLNGANCAATTPPSAGVAVNGVFVTSNAVYAASADGNVYYSNNNGLSWIAINGQPDGSAVKSVYVAANTLYVGTANEFVYTSTSLTGGGSWTTYAQTVYSLFVNSDASQIFSGTQSGYVFSLTLGMQLGFVASTLINSVFLL